MTTQPAARHYRRSDRPDAYRSALDRHAMVSITDTNGVITFANDRFCKHYGFGRDELIGVSFDIIGSGSTNSYSFQSMWQSLRAGRPWTGEFSNRNKDGQVSWVHCEASPFFDATNEPTGFVCVQRDVSTRKWAEQELRRSEEFLRSVTEVSGVGGWSLNIESGQLYWSKHTKLIHEVGPDYQPELSSAIDFYAVEAKPVITAAVENAIETGQGWDLELPLITAKGNPIWVRAVGNVMSERGQAKTLLGAFQDITERKIAQDRLFEEVANRHEAEQLLRDVIEAIPDAVAAYDENESLIIFNEKYLETYEASRDAITTGATFKSILEFGLKRGQYAEAGETEEEKAKWLDRRLDAHRHPPEELTQQLLDGTWLQIREHRSATGSTVGVRTDVTNMKRAEAELRRFAEEDPLTGLFNRARFCAELEDLIRSSVGLASEGFDCLALFDIDHFKPINDAYGHDVGDEVLRAIAERLRSVLQPSDFAARLGGDEFVFVLRSYQGLEDCGVVIGKLFDALSAPIVTSGPSLSVTLSLGAVSIQDNSLSVRELLNRADRAQYRAKDAGRARWCWFGSDEGEEISRQQEIERAFRRDLSDQGNLEFPFRPIIEPTSGVPIGFSGEVSWKHEGIDYQTTQLMQLAFRATVSKPLCDQTLERFLTSLGDLEQRGIGSGVLWITIGAEQLRLGNLAELVRDFCQESKFPPEKLFIAVEEKALSERSSSAVLSTLKLLKRAGVQIAIDGFGTAGCPLGLLRELDVGAARVSLNAARNEDTDTLDVELLAAQIVCLKELSIKAFAADVETTAELDLL
ncbi:MAG: diguanylate cyclase, partial [Pseudomonadota bacterium]